MRNHLKNVRDFITQSDLLNKNAASLCSLERLPRISMSNIRIPLYRPEYINDLNIEK